MNTALALRIENALGIEEGFFMMLQVFYDIAQQKNQQASEAHPDLAKFRPALFWETDLNKINWQRQRSAVINRVFERGNTVEKNEIIKFYGQEVIDAVLQSKTTAP